MSNEQIKDISKSEFTEICHRIVATGWGFEAIDKINHLLHESTKLMLHMADENRAKLRAIDKIANSSQTPKQKINGIKPLAEMREEDHEID